MKSVVRNDGRWSNHREDVIEIVPFDPAWEKKYREEADALAWVLPQSGWSVDHVGSTAVPGLVAKPIIDIAVSCDQRELWPSLRAPVESLGYAFWNENPDPDHMFFVKGMPPYGNQRTHHVHIRTSEYVKNLIRFRDILRADQVVRERYAALKAELAHRYRDDREAYTRAKTEFIAAVGG